MTIKLKRVYEAASQDDGTRILVERLWPRGLTKEQVDLDLWLKEVAPTTTLRRWYSHDLSKWPQFREKYTAELHANHKALKPLIDAMAQGTVTLLYSSKDTEHNSAICLKHYLEKL